jgi:addiction module HigA family antidote
MPKLKNIHPGEILREEYLTPLAITPYRLCQDTGLPQSRISEIINGKRGLSADTALRLARYLGTTPIFWLNLQMAYDLEEAQRTSGREIAAQIKPLKLAG